MARWTHLQNFLTVLLFSSSLYANVDAQPTAPSDVAALRALYTALQSPTALSTWTGDPCASQWVGVTCIAGATESYVGGLTLASMGLNGTLPLELGTMTKLGFLHASHNQLSGPLPAQLGTNGLLTILDLSNNAISGDLSQGLTNNFTVLSLSNNSLLHGWPPQLPLPTLTDLDLSGNGFTGPLPSTLGSAQSLTSLQLNRCGWSGSIPTELGTLAKLTDLRLDTNSFSGEVPSSLASLSALTRLTLFNNSLTGAFPTGLQKFSAFAYGNPSLCLSSSCTCSGTAVRICYCSGGGQGSQTCNAAGIFTPCSCGTYHLPGSTRSGPSGAISGTTLALTVVGAVVGTLLLVFFFAILAIRYSNMKRGGSGWDRSKYYIKTSLSAEAPPPDPDPSPSAPEGKTPRRQGTPGAPRRLTAMAKARSWGRAQSQQPTRGDLEEEEEEAVEGGEWLEVEGEVHRFTFDSLRRATDDFDAENVLGADGLCRVYRAVLANGQVAAVKEIEFVGNGLGTTRAEFVEAVGVVGQAQHPSLVHLLGFCCEEDSRLLVNEFVPNGSLELQLHGLEMEAVLDWNSRMHIALGAARGLAFLHSLHPLLVHGEVRSSNTMLDEQGNAKLGDFGLGLLTGRTSGGGSSSSTSHMALAAGCVAPELAYSTDLSCATDVYAFGVLLLELITGRRPLDPKRPPHEQALVRWARPRLTERNRVEGLVDWKVGGLYSSPALYQLALLGWQCIQVDPDSRPDMTQVVEVLEKVQNLPLDAAVQGGGVDPNAVEEQRLHDFLSVHVAEEEEEGTERERDRDRDRDQRPLSRTSSGGGSSEARVPLRPAPLLYGRPLGGGGSPV